jgi:hypothetical protein
MKTNYIYLLKTREFVNTGEYIYKVGRTSKENFERFNQYPKGSIIYYQQICNNCVNMERIILKLFQEKFKHKTKFGREYFEGCYKDMIDVIYSNIKNENAEVEEEVEVEAERAVKEAEEAARAVKEAEEAARAVKEAEEAEPHKIITCEEFIQHSVIEKFIVTNRAKREGYVRLSSKQLWRRFSDVADDVYECLIGWVESGKCEYISIMNKFIDVEYESDEICKDILKKMYCRNPTFYNLKYHEYAIYDTSNSCSLQYYIFNSLDYIFTPVNELIIDEILSDKNSGHSSLCVKTTVSTDIVDGILDSLVEKEVKLQYRKLLNNLIVKQEEKQLIFYDNTYGHLLTIWTCKLLYTICGSRTYFWASEYYKDKKKINKEISNNNCRCIIIKNKEDISTEKQINQFEKLGIRNIIVCTNNTHSFTHSFKKYLQDNKERLIDIIKEEHGLTHFDWKDKIRDDESIFYKNELLLPNLLKWCCAK